MAATLTFRSPLWENWQDTVAHDGGVSQIVQTNIPYAGNPFDDVFVDTTLVLNTSVGAPNFTLTYSSVGGMLAVTVANIAVAGNSAMWDLYIRSAHSLTH